MIFSDLPIGTIFTCDKGKFKKIRQGYDKYNGNAIGINFKNITSIKGSMKVVIVK